MNFTEIVNVHVVGERFSIAEDFAFDEIMITKGTDGFSWRAEFNQRLFQGNRMPTKPMTGKKIKHWKKESSARSDLIKFLENRKVI